MQVEEATMVTGDLLAALNRLVSQLSASAAPLTEDRLREVLESPATHLLVARDDRSTIIGSLTLAMFRIPTGLRAWIEDVVVDEAARGQRVGEALSRHALEMARSSGARTVELTSRPERVAANRLYARLGFARRDTNVYRYTLS